MIAYLLAQQIGVLFLMMAMGWLLVHFGLARSEDSRILSVVSIYLLMPCAVIKSFQIEYTPQIRDQFLLALTAAVAIHALLFFVTWLLGRFFHFNVEEKASIIYSNSGNLIIPLVTAVLGPEWVIFSSAFLCVQLFFIFTQCQSMMQGQPVFNIRLLLSNVNLIAIAIGLALFLTGIRLPHIPYDVVNGVSACLGPVCMLLLGIIMASVNWRETLRRKRLYLVTFLKMIVVPGVVLAFLKYSGLSHLVPDGQTILLISLLAVTTPSATTIVQFCQLYDKDAGYASSINALTTIVSILTMPLLVWMYLI